MSQNGSAAFRTDCGVNHLAGLRRSKTHLVGQAIDLDDDQPGPIGLRCRPLGHEARDQEAEVRVASVDAEDRRQERVERREDERTDERGEEPVHLDAVCQRGDHEEREDLNDKDEEAIFGLGILFVSTGNLRSAYRQYEALQAVNPFLAEDLYGKIVERKELRLA